MIPDVVKCKYVCVQARQREKFREVGERNLYTGRQRQGHRVREKQRQRARQAGRDRYRDRETDKKRTT